jgi:hypothetical protein
MNVLHDVNLGTKKLLIKNRLIRPNSVLVYSKIATQVSRFSFFLSAFERLIPINSSLMCLEELRTIFMTGMML